MSKIYFFTNMSESSICITGRTSFEIPGKCEDLRIVLPDHSAKQTVARLKQRYPLLRIKEAQVANAEKVMTEAKNIPGDNPANSNDQSESSQEENGKFGNMTNNSGKDQGNSETVAADSTQLAEKVAAVDESNQPQAQKTDKKKGK